MDADGFTIVSRGGSAAKDQKKKKKSTSRSQSLPDPSLSALQIVTHVRRLFGELKSSAWTSECVAVIAESRENSGGRARIRCRGVGCVGRSEVARLQCAFALVLHDRFGDGRETLPEFVEPMLNEEEKIALKDLGFDLETRLKPEVGDLIYAPHAPAGLYHNELLVRWNDDLLRHCVIVGNCFSNYWIRLPAGRAPLIARIEPCVIEKALPNNPDASTTFNDTAVHSFRFEIPLPTLLDSDKSHNDPEMRE